MQRKAPMQREDANEEKEEQIDPDLICLCQESAKNINTYSIVTDDVRLKRTKAIQAYARKLQHSEWQGPFRCPNACESGGFQLLDAESNSRMRGAFKEFAKLIGRKIFSGDFNLMRTSFPIKCMAKNSQLEMSTAMFSTFPSYIYYAATMTTNPIERIKYLITASIIGNYYNFMCVKPLNPILGETFQIYGQDGSQTYLE